MGDDKRRYELRRTEDYVRWMIHNEAVGAGLMPLLADSARMGGEAWRLTVPLEEMVRIAEVFVPRFRRFA